MRRGRAALLLAAGLSGLAPAVPAAAQTDFTDLTPAERAILGNEIRAVLLTLPELLPEPGARRAPAPAEVYADEIARDLDRIAARADALFAPGLPGFGPSGAAHRIALFTRPGCPDCARAEADLRRLADAHDLRVTLLDIDENAGLARALGLDMAPSYVFPDRMLRGAIPPVVLRRYLGE